MTTMTKAMKLAGALLGLMLWGAAHAGTVTYVYTDPQGTPLAEADASGNITARFEYTPYGVSVPSMGAAPNGVGYTGHVNDPETGLVYMQARYYDPGRGGFLSVDPVSPAPGNLFNFNRYDYTNNNPINHTDPDGRCADGVTCDQMVQSYGTWAAANPEEADKLGRTIGLPGVMVMAAPTAGLVGFAVLRSPLTYLAFSRATGVDLDVVNAMKAAQERQRAAELVEATKAEAKSIEKGIEEILKAAEKKNLPPPPPPPPPPQLPKLPSPPTPPAAVSVVQPETHSNDEAVILGDQFSHDG